MTNHPTCAVDGRPVHDDRGHLCPACWADLDHDLADVPELVHDLERLLAGLTRTGGSPIGIVVRAEKGLGFDERAGDLLRELHNTLGGWVRVLCEDNALPVDMRDDTAVLAGWLGQHEWEIRRHEAAGDLWREVHKLAERARKTVTPKGPRVYLGQCSVPLDDSDEPELCDRDLYALADWRSVTCPQCGITHQAGERREVMLNAVADQLATAAECSRALTAVTGVEVSVNTIRSWAARGKLAQHAPREGERWPRYRVGDVEQLLKGLATRRPA
jgi:hypothetical protein